MADQTVKIPGPGTLTISFTPDSVVEPEPPPETIPPQPEPAPEPPPPLPAPEPPMAGTKLLYYHRTPVLSSAQVSTFKIRQGIAEIDNVNQPGFDDNGDRKFDGVTSTLMNYLRDTSSTWTGLYYFDWEYNGSLRNLSGFSGDAAQQQQMAEYIKATDAIRKLRPKAKFGYYDYPYAYPNAYKNNATWLQTQMEKTAPLAAKIDYTMPSLYCYFKIGVEGTRDEVQKWVGNKVRAALKAPKPCIPFIMHVYDHPGTPYHKTAIPPMELYHYVVGMAEANVAGRTIAGLLFWTGSSFVNFPPTDAQWKAVRQALDGKQYTP